MLKVYIQTYGILIELDTNLILFNLNHITNNETIEVYIYTQDRQNYLVTRKLLYTYIN
jgi:hypothetical protein